MNAARLGALEQALNEWGEKEIWDDGLPENTYWPDHLIENMAKAAAAVFDANIDGQVFMRREDGRGD